MAKAQRPGKSFMEMLALTLKNQRGNVFTPHLLMAIFWEESLFTNRAQIGGGRGVGFGQVERQNFFWLKQKRAEEFGYFVPGLSTNTMQLDDDRAVQVAFCYLLHLYFHPDNKARSQDWSLKGYGGVREADGTPLTPAKRQAIIDGWKACALHLQMLPFSVYSIVNYPLPVRELEDQIIDALKKSKPFDPDIVFQKSGGGTVTFRELLFPRYWAFPPATKQQVASFLPPGMYLQVGSRGGQVSLLQRLLNAQPVPPNPPLATDGIFGPKTRGGVQSFQRQHGLAADGIVGPRTKEKLVS